MSLEQKVFDQIFHRIDSFAYLVDDKCRGRNVSWELTPTANSTWRDNRAVYTSVRSMVDCIDGQLLSFNF